MKKHFGKALLSATLAAAMIFTAVPASAAGTTSTGAGKVYAPADIIDVVVPTSLKIAFNPAKVTIPANDAGFGLAGNSQILSGTYAIENRSTVPVDMKVDFTVTAGAKSKAGTLTDIATEEAKGEKAASAIFALEMITTAAGTAQKPGVEPEGDATGDVRANAAMEDTKTKVAKASAKNINITTDKAGKAATKNTTDFILNAGPYTAAYDKENDSVSYQVKSGAAFDTVAFTFTGTTTTYMPLWVADATKPATVSATYTLTKLTSTVYAQTGFSNIWKGVPLADTDATATFGLTGTANAKFDGEVTMPTKKVDGNDVDNPAGLSITIQSLQPDAQKVTAKGDQLGITGASNISTTDGISTLSFDAAAFAALQLNKVDIPAGFYLLTIGKTTSIVKYTAK